MGEVEETRTRRRQVSILSLVPNALTPPPRRSNRDDADDRHDGAAWLWNNAELTNYDAARIDRTRAALKVEILARPQLQLDPTIGKVGGSISDDEGHIKGT